MGVFLFVLIFARFRVCGQNTDARNDEPSRLTFEHNNWKRKSYKRSNAAHFASRITYNGKTADNDGETKNPFTSNSHAVRFVQR